MNRETSLNESCEYLLGEDGVHILEFFRSLEGLSEEQQFMRLRLHVSSQLPPNVETEVELRAMYKACLLWVHITVKGQIQWFMDNVKAGKIIIVDEPC